MAYTTPTTLAPGNILTAAIWNASVRDNILYLKDRADNPARASVYHNAAQSLGNGSVVALAFNTELTDSGLHDPVTNNSRMTIPAGEGGWWHFSAFVEFAANATGQRKLDFRSNGTSVLGGIAVDAAASGVTRLMIAVEFPSVAGDYWEVIASQNSGGALNVSSLCIFNARRTA